MLTLLACQAGHAESECTERGPDFTYQATPNDPVTYFELLTDTRASRVTHDDRHGAYLWRAVFYSFGGAAGSAAVSDIE